MKNYLKPTSYKKIGDNYILWFENSNQYVVVSSFIYKLVLLYLDKSSYQKWVESCSSLQLEISELNRLYREISTFLTQANKKEQASNLSPKTDYPKNTPSVEEIKFYKYQNVCFNIKFSKGNILNIIKNPIEHLQDRTRTALESEIHFQLICDKNHIYFLKNNTLISIEPLNRIHYIQGKVTMEILKLTNQIEESKFIATFHSAAIGNGKKGILITGISGSGKSTLSALLASQGFDILSDDLTPMIEGNLILSNPSALSIKEGAFNTIESTHPNFRNSGTILNLKKNIKVKYLPLKKFSDRNTPLPCHQIIKVNYSKKSKESLKKINCNSILETLIPDSWISPKKENAESFLNWISQCQFYELTYNENQFAIDQLKALFKTTLS
ncbi:hypothetical protein LRR18_04455 [Mangrovimonas sp. AS39]|uniref:hypothetical protein n=2 Tax=Mangrovimonas futianensis TaxID=2895523 RepID=UPI001E52DB0D|nr:hypothetical protein [Mangrovimonas futianensis]MCF1190828.1 hypothetical protein [Mangrovimonas futianensis]